MPGVRARTIRIEVADKAAEADDFGSERGYLAAQCIVLGLETLDILPEAPLKGMPLLTP